jgi:PAS domain S-box-containing protein
MNRKLHVLIVEDNPADVDFLRDALPETRPIQFQSESVPRLSEALARLAAGGIDLVLTDLGLPDSQGLATFRKLRHAAPDLVIIVLTGNDDQEMAVAAVQEGAQDFLVKGQISGSLLVRAVRCAIERKRVEEALQEKVEELQKAAAQIKTLHGILPICASCKKIRDDQGYWNQVEVYVRDHSEAEFSHAICPECTQSQYSELEQTDGSAPEGDGGAAELRRHAETIARGEPALPLDNFDALSPEKVREALHELRVHQIELKMQNKELRRAQLEQEASRARYLDLYEMAPVGYCTLSETGLLLEVNNAAASLLGRARGALVKQPITRFILPEDQDIYYLHHKQLFETGELQACELRMLGHDGTPFWARLEATTAWDAAGTPEYRVVLRDITERKRAEEKLQQLSMAVEQSFVSTVITNISGEIEYVNPKFIGLTGYTQAEVIGRRMHILNPGDNSPEACKAVWETITAGKEWCGEFHNKKKNGELYWENVSISPILDPSGRITHFLAIKEDITERKKAEAEQKKMEDQLLQAQKMEAIGTLAGGIAHDFNNILSVIIGTAELLNLSSAVVDPTRKGLIQVLSACERARKLVSQILAFSRHGKQEKILISLKPIVKESQEFLRASLPSLIELRHYLEPEAGTIMADPSQMQQVLMNLCVNAGHSMEKDGGVLQIKLSNTTLTEEDTRFDPDVEPGDFVKLTVSDTGHGMEPSVLERIFDPYFTTKERGKGTGLGLSVVHGIVKSHGGMIKVDSEVGKGTTFTIFLPRAMGFEKLEDTPLQPLAMGIEKILFVDDESALADLGQQLIGELGYQVETRTSPIEALEAFRVNPQKFDLVITDLTMPHMSGLNLARKIMEIRPGMPIILCTGFSEQANEQAPGTTGIRAVLYKPLVLRDIADAVRKVLDDKMPGRR